MILRVIDIETTGFNSMQDNILEVGYITTNEKCEILGSGRFYFYQDGWNINTPAKNVHGLTKEFLETKANEFVLSASKLYTIMQNGIIVGKNSMNFDIPFIKNFMYRYFDMLPEINLGGYLDLQDYFTPIYREAYKKATGQETKKKGTLTEYVHMIGLKDEEVEKMYYQLFEDEDGRGQAHSALYDAFETYLLMKYAVDNLGMELVKKR